MHSGVPSDAEITVVPEVEKDSEETNEIMADDENPSDKNINVDTSSMKTNLEKESVEPVGSDLPEIDVELIGDVINTIGEVHFVTGSSYQGTWDAVGMTGTGRYVMSHGVAYEGQFRNNMFHGKGTLRWPQNQRIDGTWKYGKLQEYSFTFGDGLEFESSNWKYCEFPDRRFHISPNIEVQPAGRSLKTRVQPTRLLPPGCYDTGDGVFDPRTYCVTSYDNPKKVLRIPKKDERDWIVANCRKASYEPTGYRSDLKKACKEDVSGQKNIPFSKESPDDWWQRMTTFERDLGVSSDNEELKGRSEYGEYDDAVIRPTTCACRGFGKLGESCYCIYLQDSRSQSSDGEGEEYKDDLQKGREISCDEMNDFDGENSWKLLGTVCGPTKSTHTLVRDFEIKSSAHWSDEENIWNDNIEEKILYEIKTEIPKKSEKMDSVSLKQSKEETIQEKEDSIEKIFDYINEEREADWQEMEEETIPNNKNMEEKESENEILSRILESKLKEANKKVEGTVEIQNERNINKDEEEGREKNIERKSMFNEFFAIEEEQMEYEEIDETDSVAEIKQVQQMEEIEKAKESSKAEQIEEIDQVEDNGEIRKTSKVMETKKNTGGYPTSKNKKEKNLKSGSEFSWQSKKKVAPIAALEKQQNRDGQLREKIKDDNKMKKEIELHDKNFFESEQLIFQDKLQRGEKLEVEEKELDEIEEEKLRRRMSFFEQTIPRANEEKLFPDFRSPLCNIEFVRKSCDADVCMKKSSESIHPPKKCRADRLPVNVPAKRQELQRDKHTN
ncbi:nexilin isoform X3 [Cephus cinctus]|uniref:MORN repeat-containing protein 5 n=1 Tax=Cephus cinctus TaxID=211228 RepID=A0AAJ7REA1_CEPCN|nr:nexilin isoform X3 [Cephus cinctus]